jgi:hypothetical protein
LSYLNRLTQRSWLWTAVLVGLTPLAGFAQGDTTPQQNPDAGNPPASESTPPDQNTPAPAFGLGATTATPNENPPVSALDQPSLEPGTVSRSFLAPGAILSESADSNVEGTGIGNSATSAGLGGVTRAMGALALQKIWSHYETDLQYIGGGIFYQGVNHKTDQTQDAELAQRIVWRTGQLVLRDGVSYLPEGNFGAGSYGGSGALQSGLAGLGSAASTGSASLGSALGGNLGAGQFGSVGDAPRLTNSAVADLAQAITPRSSVTFAGSYGFVHFTDNSFGLVDSSQAAAQLAYDRQINRTDQVAVLYAFQNIHFPQVSGSSVTTNAVRLIYGHRVTGRMDFVVGAGPQFTHMEFEQQQPPPQPAVKVSTDRISASGNLRLRYRFPRTSLQLEYRHYNTNGSGYFLGASTDVGTFSVVRPLGRIWEANIDTGVANNDRLKASASTVPATSDRYLFAGGALHRHIGRHYRGFISYQYDRLSFDACSGTACGKVSNRQMGVVGIEWYPRPIRLD